MMPLKPVDKKKNPGLAKLPTKVRNKMGYMKEGGMATKRKKKEEKELSIDPLKLANPKKKIKPFLSSEPVGEGKQLPLKKASGGMARRDKDEEKALKGIEKQQKSQAKRAEQAHKDVREYSRKKARKMKKGGMVLEIGLRPASKEEMKMAKKMKDGGSVEGKRLTRTTPPQKGPNSQGMRGTGSAIRGTKFKGVF